jgi:hypothetical protein
MTLAYKLIILRASFKSIYYFIFRIAKYAIIQASKMSWSNATNTMRQKIAGTIRFEPGFETIHVLENDIDINITNTTLEIKPPTVCGKNLNTILHPQ